MGTAKAVRAAATSEFKRGLHLGLALLALVHAPLVMRAMLASRRLLAEQHGVAASYALGSVVALAFTAAVAWLALVAFDTRSGVTVWPRRWPSSAWLAFAVFVAVEAVSVAASLTSASASPDRVLHYWMGPYVVDGRFLVGWFVLTCSASSLAEELVYRAMLLRALEGYIADPRSALVVHALVFELAHVYGYGLPFSGVWFVYGLVYGYAFQATRSVGVPTLMHIAHNLTRAAVTWHVMG